jgi:hypothetical protein
MKTTLAIPAKSLRLPGGKGDRTDNWVTLFMDWLPSVMEMLARKVGDNERPAYNDELSATLGTIAGYEYLARGERDRALAHGFERFPKGTCNSDEQVALARNVASEEDRLHKLLKELHEAVRTRLSSNQTSINFYRQQLQSGT